MLENVSVRVATAVVLTVFLVVVMADRSPSKPEEPAVHLTAVTK